MYQISFVRKNIFNSNEIKWSDVRPSPPLTFHPYHTYTGLQKSCDPWLKVRSLRTIVSCAAVLYSHPLGAAAFDANGGAPCCLG
jgi:hypothetical protein